MNHYPRLAELSANRVRFVVATVVSTGGSSPQKAGAKMVVLAEGQAGTIGGGAVELQVVRAARALLEDPQRTTQLFEVHLTRDLGMCCGGQMSVFLEKAVPSERVVIFGAGHVGKALAEAAKLAGFEVMVVDARPEWLNADRFPSAERLLDEPAAVAGSMPADDRIYACVMTHDHGLDQDVVLALARRPLRYLGLIGSRRKAEQCRARLAKEGCDGATVARLHSPMGLSIGAQTPEEIAISIVAELVALRRGVVTLPAGAAQPSAASGSGTTAPELKLA